MRRYLVVFICSLFTLTLLAQQKPTPITYHVAPTGKDTNPGTADRPFATVHKARNVVRTLHRKQAVPVNVVIRGGTYRLTAPLEFTPEDSGTATSPVVYAAPPGETPILSGGKTITGWKSAKVGNRTLWTVDLPEVRAGKWSFHQLWVNGVRRTRARHPNNGVLRIAGLPDVTPKTPRYPGQKRFMYAPGDLKRYDNLTDVDVVALHLWVAVRMAITDIDEEKHIVNFAKQSLRTLKDGPEFARYYIENALELLDAPGEWYLDRKKGTLYYHPMPGESITTTTATAPVLPAIVRFVGQPEKKKYVEHLTLRGLTFAHAEWWPARNDTLDIQAVANVPAVVQGDGVRNCVLEKCTVTHASNYGIHLARGCSHNRIDHCEVQDLCAGGIRIGETTIRKSLDEQTYDNAVTHCRLHDLGKAFHQAVGLWVGQSYKNRLTHNHIHDVLYTGISVGWTWGYGATLARDNVIENNHVHDIGKELLSDMGGIYTLGKQPGTVIRGNVFHDISAYHYGGWGIYFDEGSSNIVAEKNLVYRTKHGGFHQHYGRDNIVRNNIFAFGKHAQIRRSRNEPHTSFTFERNIVYYKEGKLLDGTWEGTGYKLDHNLYYRTDGKIDNYGKWSFAQWQKRGQDQHSLWANPNFADAAKMDFRLKPDNPVVKKIEFEVFVK